MRRFARPGSDLGASAILVALTVAVLFGFAAIAIDATGIGFNERRQAQSASDVGALAAVQFATPSDVGHVGCNSYSNDLDRARCNGAAEAIEVANATIDDPSLLDWSDGARCASPPAGFTVSPITDCVAFNSNMQRAWVRIPSIDRPTTVARVIGIDSISVSADAIAGSDFAGGGDVLPFLIPGNAAMESYNCLKTGPNPNFGACDDLPSTGNFGSMDFYLYGNEKKDYTSKCSGDTNGRLAANIARGVDHPLGIHPTGSGSGIEEEDNCPNFEAEPDMARGQPGVGSALEDGMLYGGSAYAASAYPGRIAGGFTVRNGGGSTPQADIDDTPLWSFLLDVAALEGTACDDAVVNTPSLMVTCVAWARSTGTLVFDTDLASATRFGFTPAVYEMDFATPGSSYHISGYVPVYIDTTLFGCNASGCSIMHTPGVTDGGACVSNPLDPQTTCGTPGPKNKNLEAVTAYVLSKEIVPANAQNPAPGDANQREFNLSE